MPRKIPKSYREVGDGHLPDTKYLRIKEDIRHLQDTSVACGCAPGQCCGEARLGLAWHCSKDRASTHVRHASETDAL